MILQPPLRRNRRLPPLAPQRLRIVQLQQRLHLRVREAQLLALRLSLRDHSVGAGREHVEVQRGPPQLRFGLNVLEVLLQHEDIELQPVAAGGVHDGDGGRRADDEVVEEGGDAVAD